MKHLYFCRHAHAGESPRGDFYRELDQLGREQAAELAWHLHRERSRPNLILSSPAPRALQTAEIVAKRLAYPSRKILTEQEFYAQDFEKLIAFFRRLDRVFDRVVIVGHNPTVSDLAGWISGTPVKLDVAGHVAVKVFSPEWAQAIRFRSGRLKLPHGHQEEGETEV